MHFYSMLSKISMKLDKKMKFQACIAVTPEFTDSK